MRLLAFLFIIAFFVLFSCKNNDDSSKPNPYAAKILSQLNTSDTFFYEIPNNGRYWDSVSLAFKRKDENFLNLESIERGFDSVQIRIWYGCYLTGWRLVRLIHFENKWKAELSDLHYHASGEEGGDFGYDSVTRNVLHKAPKSGWIDFINKLFELKVLTLPDQYNIPFFQADGAMDGCATQFEISSENAYRYYKYENPDPKYWQAYNVIMIIKLLSKEFEISEWPGHSDEIKKDKKKKFRDDSSLTLKDIEFVPIEDSLNKSNNSN